MHYQERSLGAYSELAQLASYQLAARYLTINKKTRALSQLNGPFKSLIRGRGMEFEDVRLYQAGDDIRTIDWRVTARTGKTHTKQFREEREKPVLVIVDQRKNMFFGSEMAMKSVLANDLAAYLLWAAFHKGDRVGGLAFNDKGHTEIRPRRQRKTILSFLHQLVEYNHQLDNKHSPEHHSIRDVLLETKRIARPGTQVFIISDCHDLGEDCSALLHDIARHCQISVLLTYDKLETQLPPAGIYPASNGEKTLVFNTRNQKARQQYHSDFEQHMSNCKTLLGKYHIPMIPVSTADSPLDLLKQVFGESR